jgi:signal transduction histidine kinase
MTAVTQRLRKRRPRIRRRLGVLAAAVTTAVVLAFCIPLAVYVRSVAYDRGVDSAELLARSLAAELVTVHELPSVARLVRQVNGAAATPAVIYLVDGTVAGARWAPRLPITVERGRAANLPAPGGGRRVYEPVRGPSLAYAVMVTVPAGLLTQGVARDWAFLFGGGAVLVLLAVGLADRLGRSIVRPIEALEEVTRGLRDGDLERRVRPAGPLEVAEVGQAVNELADRIGGLLQGARIAAADLGHRLRTPLTSLRLDVESLDPTPARDALARDLETLESAVNRLIHETREAPTPPGRCWVAEAVRSRMTFWSVLANAQGRSFHVEMPPSDAEVAVSKDELEAAVDALLSNVFIHTEEGTPFRVALRAPASTDGPWTLLVEDDGRGSATSDSSNGSRRVGTGLGLDIVRRTAERAGGAVELGVSPAGGFSVKVLLPGVAVPLAGGRATGNRAIG